MNTFLKETALEILNKNINLKDVVCILPSERAGISLKQEFRYLLKGKASFLPRIISIENFIKEISGLETIDQISLLFQFYQVYKQENKNKAIDDFESFIGWASVILQDFNEIDRHLVNPKEIFEYMSDIQSIKEWSLEKDEMTQKITHYLSFIKDLNQYYQGLSRLLLEKKIAYQGLVYKEANNNCNAYLNKNLKSSFCFIGFNALNKAEEQIFQQFLTHKQNRVFWDADVYYTQNNHEAGTFLRKFFNNWNCLSKDSLDTLAGQHFKKSKKINIIGAPLNVTGVKYANTVLFNALDFKKTAMVLAEESLLPVMLNSISPKIDKVNITMGYALSNIPLTDLFKTLFNLHLNQQKLGKEAFYYQDVLAFLKHPFILKVSQNKSKDVVSSIQKNNLIFLNTYQLLDLCKQFKINDLIVKLFKSNDVSVLLDAISRFLNNLSEVSQGLDALCIEKYKEIFRNVIELNLEYKNINSLKVLQKIFSRLLSLETLDFKGDALEGLQLMGVLETRCLDFENVIITSVNEGILPSGKKERSFISHEVKKHFKMPTYLAKDAIFSYHFYRLLQRAKNIYLVYNTKTDDFGGGEMSRFLTQLMLDKEGQVCHQNIRIPNRSYKASQFEIKKSPRIIELLQVYFKKGISPSRITDYINDPLSFYKNIVLKIRAVEEVEEEVASNTLGTIVHDSLELLYQPFLNKILVVQDFKLMKNQAESIVLNKFKEYFKEGEITTGKNRLTKEVALQFVFNFLNSDLALVQKGKELVVLDLENEYIIPLTTPKGHKINLKGKIDRVDELDGVRRIVDYKTGKVEVSNLKTSNRYLFFKELKFRFFSYEFCRRKKTEFK